MPGGGVDRRSPRQWRLTGKFHGDTDRRLVAVQRPSSLYASRLIIAGRRSTLSSLSCSRNRMRRMAIGSHPLDGRLEPREIQNDTPNACGIHMSASAGTRRS